MEFAKDEIFNVKYNTKLNRLEIGKKHWTSSAYSFFRKHMIINIALIAFVLLSSINFILIYNFVNILTNM